MVKKNKTNGMKKANTQNLWKKLVKKKPQKKPQKKKEKELKEAKENPKEKAIAAPAHHQ